MSENIANNTPNNARASASSLLPDFCDIRIIFIIILLTEILAIVFAITVSSNSTQFWDFLALASLLMLWIALLDAAIICQLRSWLHKQQDSHCLIITFSILMAVSLAVALFASEVINRYYDNNMLDTLFTLRVATISAVIYLLLLRYFYIQHQWRINTAAQSRAEIQALRARIRPHFLFNSMNTIASLISISPNIAEKSIEDLSDLFRASLSEKNMTTLAEELELTKSYLAIETLRLGDRLQIEWQIDESLLKTEVPSLIIQPLAENSIYHGIEPISKGGKIIISALQIGNKLKLSISNPIMSEKQSSAFRKGNQMAQDNIKQRLKLVYGKKGDFSINDTKDNYTVSLLIPLDVNHECFDS